MPRILPTEHALFDALPVRMVTVGAAGSEMAIHAAAAIGSDCTPVICVPGYNRNMADFAEFARLAGPMLGPACPILLVDLKGRGRSSDRRRAADYSSLVDAADLLEIVRALAIERAIFVGQGYGGQVVMALAGAHARVIAGTVLIDAGPVNDSRGLVRLRTTLHELMGVRGEPSLKPMLRRMISADYPDAPEATIETLTTHTHFVDGRGRLQPLFDPALVRLLEPFDLDDVLVAQWPLFDALDGAPLMMMRTEHTQQLRRETFEEMMRRRRDAEAYVIEQQGSPALLDNADDVQPIVDFVLATAGIRQAA